MDNQAAKNDPSQPDDHLVGELSQLVSAVCDQVYSAEQQRRLNALLGEDQAARDCYLRFIEQHWRLQSTAGSFMRQEFESIAQRLASNLPIPSESGVLACSIESPEEGRVTPAAPEMKRTNRTRLVSSAVIAATLLVSVAFWRFGPEPQAVSEPSGGPVDNGVAAARAGEGLSGSVAKVTRLSANVLWQDRQESFSLQSRVPDGQSLVLTEGELELSYDSGVRLRLIGPAEFRVHPEGGELARGGIVAFVPESGHGFTIETPNGKVVDLGTEFGVVVDDFGVSEVSVFSGKVEAYPAGAAGNLRDRIELIGGDGLQWNREALLARHADPSRFLSALAVSPSVRRSMVPLEASFDSDFEREPLAANDWRALGSVQRTQQGVALSHQPNDPHRPYLVSRRQFDPSSGPVSVECEFELLDGEGPGSPSIAVLTRSSGETGPAGTEWEDIMGTGVRCCFRADEETGEGVLEIATKQEEHRELNNISWRGFRSPKPGERYRLRVRDDGVNVEFTLSLLDNPDVRKTVKCRSLFNGYQNFIAVEGSGTEGVLIKRISVDQEETTRGSVVLWPSERRDDGASILSGRAKVAFDELLPTDAELVIEDSFEDSEIDAGAWDTLGNVRAVSGRIRLGNFYDSVHIDTWHARPYLLSRRTFSEEDKRITVVGRIEFAENFLTGYGGSFAVFTRASDERGGGAEWQRSVLSRGVRSNFWPLGLSTQRSLEIHQWESTDELSLLSSTSFPINPRSRSYLFKLVDAGETAELTLIDANDIDKRSSISVAMEGDAPRSGLIGFESCWGSPVMLDDIKVFLGP